MFYLVLIVGSSEKVNKLILLYNIKLNRNGGYLSVAIKETKAFSYWTKLQVIGNCLTQFNETGLTNLIPFEWHHGILKGEVSLYH